MEMNRRIDSFNNMKYANRMTKVLTIRLAAEDLAHCDAEARRLGVTRTDFVRSRLLKDAPQNPHGKRVFLSKDLVGSMEVGNGSTNPKVRRILARRAGS